MDKLSYIEHVLADIECRLDTELTPEDIAGRHYVSLRGLYRDFYACTGHSIKDYVRKRRISNACEKIKFSELPLAIIAQECGYQTQQAFNRQFKRVVGMAPLEYRSRDACYCFYPHTAARASLVVKVGSEFIPKCESERFYSAQVEGIEDGALGLLPDGFVGRVFGRNGERRGNDHCYELLLESNGPGRSGFFATCVVNYNEPEISGGWNYLHNEWLPDSMFEASGDGYFEEYIFKYGRPYRLKLFLPVIKRRLARHIIIEDIPAMCFATARSGGPDAERAASERVVSELGGRLPLTIKNARRFYACVRGDEYECGVECDQNAGPFRGTLSMARIPAGRYAVLEDDCPGDIRRGAKKIDTWLQNNCVAHEDSPIFAVYELADSRRHTREGITMKLYKRLKTDKNR